MDFALLNAELKRDEGINLKPYRDTVGKLTIGIGRNLDDVGITEDEANALLRADVNRTIADLDRQLSWWRNLSEVRQRVLVNMAFNLGIGGLMKFQKMLTAMKSGDYVSAAQEALDSAWASQVGARADRLSRMIADG
jgi:lysozyme